MPSNSPVLTKLPDLPANPGADASHLLQLVALFCRGSITVVHPHRKGWKNSPSQLSWEVSTCLVNTWSSEVDDAPLHKHQVMPWCSSYISSCRLPRLSQCCLRTVMLQQTNGPAHPTPCLTGTSDGFFRLKYEKVIFFAWYQSKVAKGKEFCKLGQRMISLCYARWSEKLRRNLYDNVWACSFVGRKHSEILRPKMIEKHKVLSLRIL